MKRYEPFKESTKSLCKDCFNIQKDCFEPTKVTKTDAKTGKAYVKDCAFYNREFNFKKIEPRSTNG